MHTYARMSEKLGTFGFDDYNCTECTHVRAVLVLSFSFFPEVINLSKSSATVPYALLRLPKRSVAKIRRDYCSALKEVSFPIIKRTNICP